MLETDAETGFPTFAPQRIVAMIDRFFEHGDYYGERYVSKLELGWQFESLGERFSTLPGSLIRSFYDDDFWPLVLFYDAGDGNGDWPNAQIFSGSIVDTFDAMKLYLGEFGTLAGWSEEAYEGDVVILQWVVWRLMQFRVGVALDDCFSYRQRPGAGNTTTHPIRRYIYPGNADYQG